MNGAERQSFYGETETTRGMTTGELATTFDEQINRFIFLFPTTHFICFLKLRRTRRAS